MRKKELLTFTFIVNFRGGTYCTQVHASDVTKSVLKWIEQITKEQNQIQYLGDKIFDELKKEAGDENNELVPLKALKNIWYTNYTTKQGTFHINIVQTDLQ